MPLFDVKQLLLNPVFLADGVERTDNLLAIHTTEAQSYLLEVAFVKLAQLVQEHSLVAGDTLNLFRIVKTAKVYPCAIVEHDAVLLEPHFVRHAINAVDGRTEVCINGLLYRSAHLTHDEVVHSLGICGEDE